MNTRAIRIGLLVAALVLQAGTIYKLLETDRRIADARAWLARFDAHVERLLVATSDLRGAQQAYGAPGQGDEYWKRRVTELLQGIGEHLDAIRTEASRDAAQVVAVAADQVKGLRDIDTRTRSLIAEGDRLMAADLAFGEAREAAANLAGQIEEARARERKAREAEINNLRLIEGYLLGGALGIGLIAMLLLLPGGRAVVTPLAEAAPLPAGVGRPGGLGLGSATSSPARSTEPRVPPDLWATARLCSDLGRVAEADELGGLLERAAPLLGASGIIVWVANPTDGILKVAVGHGYPPEVLARIDAIRVDADNATAAAFRGASMEIVPAEAGASGALVVPLVGSSGCVGVMSAEVAAGREFDEATRAIATILGAQMATLVHPAVHSV